MKRLHLPVLIAFLFSGLHDAAGANPQAYDPLGLAVAAIGGAPPGVTISEAPMGSIGNSTALTNPDAGTIQVDVNSISEQLPGGDNPAVLVEVLIIVVEHEIRHTPAGGDTPSQGGYNRNICQHLNLGREDIQKIATLLCDAQGAEKKAFEQICKIWSNRHAEVRKRLRDQMQCDSGSPNFPPPAPPCSCPD